MGREPESPAPQGRPRHRRPRGRRPRDELPRRPPPSCPEAERSRQGARRPGGHPGEFGVGEPGEQDPRPCPNLERQRVADLLRRRHDGSGIHTDDAQGPISVANRQIARQVQEFRERLELRLGDASQDDIDADRAPELKQLEAQTISAVCDRRTGDAPVSQATGARSTGSSRAGARSRNA